MTRNVASILLVAALACATATFTWRSTKTGAAATPKPTATASPAPTATPLPAGALKLRVVNDLNGNAVADSDEPGIGGWHVVVGCGDALMDVTTDDQGYFVDLRAASDRTESVGCYRAGRPFGWWPTGGVATQRISTSAYRSKPFPITFKNLGPTVMELSGEFIVGGLPAVQGVPSVADPFFKCGHLYQVSYTTGHVEEAVIVEGSDTRPGCPSTGDLVTPADNGRMAGIPIPFEPGQSRGTTFIVGADSMRFYATDVSGASVLDIASGTVTTDCAVVVPPDFVSPDFGRVFVLAEEVRKGCGADGRLVQFYRNGKPLTPMVEWKAGGIGVREFTAAAPHIITPPNTGSAGLLLGAHAD
jgi:hypothetical protein